METVKKKDFTIGEASMRSGLSVKQIRYLEERNYISVISRIVCGERAYRVFSEEDLVSLLRIKHYLDEGFTLKFSAYKAKMEISKIKGGVDGDK